jgi:hypothetical protein
MLTTINLSAFRRHPSGATMRAYDLRRDRPLRRSRQLTTIDVQSLYSCRSRAIRPPALAWLSEADFRRLLPVCCPSRLVGQALCSSPSCKKTASPAPIGSSTSFVPLTSPDPSSTARICGKIPRPDARLVLSAHPRAAASSRARVVARASALGRRQDRRLETASEVRRRR